MKRWLLIGAGAFVAVACAGGAAYYFLAPGSSDTAGAADAHAAKTASRDTATVDRNDNVAQLMHELASVQDAVAYGSKDAIANQRRLTAEIDESFSNFESKDWSLYRNFRAALVFVLSGGEPDIIERALADNTSVGEADEKLARGIMSFAIGEAKAARTVFDEIDPRSLDTALVGPFALARASLYLEKDPEQAIKFLDEARLACPHTAIDEAAMRREIPLLIAQGSLERAKFLVADYLRRFGKSLYAPKMFRDFAGEMAKSLGQDEEAFVLSLAEQLDTVDPKVIAKFFISIAAEALPHGHLQLAKASAEEVLKLKMAAPEDVARAKLYVAAANAPSPQSAQALTDLRAMGDSGLSLEDAGIREVAQFVAGVVSGSIRPAKYVPPAGTSLEVKPASPVEAHVSSTLAEADGAVKKAESFISESDR